MIVVWLFLAVPRVWLQFVIVVFPEHTHLQILTATDMFTPIQVSATVLPAKSDSDVMFVYKVNRDYETIDHLCINPIRRIGLKHKLKYWFAR